MKRISAVLVLGLVLSVAPAAAQSSDERAAAREVVGRQGDAIVTIMATLKARMSQGGKDNPAPDQAVRASATVIDPSGLAVVALSAIDPGNIISKTPAIAMTKMTFTTDLVDVKMRLPDGKEIPAKVVLRDSDLDLLFVRPVAAPAAPMTSVQGSAPALSILDPVVVAQRLGDLAGWKTAATLGTVSVVIDKPRTLYVVAGATAAEASGASVFDLKGQFVGVVTLRATEDSKTSALNGLQGNALQTLGLVPVVVPAADIREIAKQVK